MDIPLQGYQYLIDDIYPRLVRAVIERYQKNSDKNLLDVYHKDDAFLKIHPETIPFLVEQREAILQILEDKHLFNNLVQVFLMASLEFTYASNQFIYFNMEEEQRLEILYRAYLQAIKQILINNQEYDKLEEELNQLIRAHFEDLSHNLVRFGDPTTEIIPNILVFRQVVCREYSPQFQMEIMGLTLSNLIEPVLDIGCGKDGYLVRYLRQQGIQAVGIDRLVGSHQGLIAEDWLNMPLRKSFWGTVISHMAFSNHFLFQHYYSHGNPQPYARQYMKILSALKPGGQFIYAPGLPFFEQLLPSEEYVLYVKKIDEHLSEEKAKLSLINFQTSWVTRLYNARVHK
ncbi:MAG: hypothetical protein CVU39_27815 [Chloroflexi bacterium HGW-Chloroflexi-10]|nr:MAG: hypothetical protein CVU39_27815 [Chloroflexi bacterium HGW-Chloroflexi-10]